MKNCSEDNVRAYLLNKYSAEIAERGLTPERVTGDFDLFKEGIIDSLGVLEIISGVEEEFGVQLDMEHIDAEKLTVLGPFCRHCAANWTQALPNDA